MKSVPLLLSALLALSVLPARAADPPELIALRDRNEVAMWKATAPLVSENVKALALLQDRFSKAGNVQAAIAVDNELNKVLANLRGHSLPHHIPVINILSATYRDAEDHSKAADTTAFLKKIYESGAPRVRLTTKEGADSKDPSYNKKKETLLIYTSDGEKKEAVFPEAATLDFRRDLK